MRVYLLWHVHEVRDGERVVEDEKLIGVYSTRRRALAAKRRVGKQPGFVGTAEGFVIDEYGVDETQWTEGFVTESHGA